MRSSRRTELSRRRPRTSPLLLALPLCLLTCGACGPAHESPSPPPGEGEGTDAGTPADDAGDERPDQGPAATDQGTPYTGPGAFSLATYNVRNLFDTTDDPQEDDVLSQAQLARKLGLLATVIASLDADVVALQEVEHAALLDALFAQPQLAGRGYAYRRLIEAQHPRGIDVAVASRLPLELVVTHQNDRWVENGHTYYFNPDCLEVRFFVGQRRAIVLINHLPSKGSGTEMDPVRVEMGRRLRVMVDNLLGYFPGAAVAVVGDFNDTSDSPTLAAARGDGPQALHDLTDLVPAASRYTFTYDGTPQLLDHILVTPGLAGNVAEGATRIPHDDDSRMASDHSPVVTRFSW